MGGLKRHNRLTDFVRLFWFHRKLIEEYMPKPHPINKYKDHISRGSIISTGELCEIFTLSKVPLAKKFCFSFGMESGMEIQFNKMIKRLEKHGKDNVANELKKRKELPYIDLQYSANLLTPSPGRDDSNYSAYLDSSFFCPDYQFLSGRANGYAVDWVILEQAIERLEQRLSSTADNADKFAQRKGVERQKERCIDDLGHLLAKTSEFDPTSEADAREKIEQSIVIRRGQPAFRDALLKAYGSKCAISRCTTVEALEAAHILPFKGEQWNHPSNGILLRADIHALFDLHLISVDPNTYRAVTSPYLQDTEYKRLNGEKVVLPDPRVLSLNADALSKHYEQLL